MSSSCGMGAVIIWQDGEVVVTSVNPLGPAGVSGEVLVGDRIEGVGGVRVTSVEQARGLIMGPVGSKFVLKLKRNIDKLGFDTFHVLIERRPSTAPNSPQTPAPRGISTPSTPSLSSALRGTHDANGIITQKSTPQNDDSEFSSSSPISSATKTSAIDPAIGNVRSAPVSSKLQGSQIDGRDWKVEAQDSMNETTGFNSPARISEARAFRNPNAHMHTDNARPISSQAPCNRKLTLDADVQDLHADTEPQDPAINIYPANDFMLKPMCHSPSAAAPSAEQLVALEVAVSLAAAAQEKETITAWISSQEQEISITDSPPTLLLQESMEQRLQERKVWGMVNSTILSDLMKSLGPKSIFHH